MRPLQGEPKIVGFLAKSEVPHLLVSYDVRVREAKNYDE